MFYDCHTHSSISSDSQTPMADMVRAARQMGLLGITITEHVDIGFPAQHCTVADLELYKKTYQQVAEDNADFPVLLGVELGYEYGREEESAQYVKDLDPDFVINSVHSMDDMTLFCDEIYPAGLEHKTYSHYLEKVRDSIDGCIDYDAIGHIGFVAKKALYPDPMLRYYEFADQLDDILLRLIEMGHALEANTSGYRNCRDTLPETAILRRYRQLGGELLTLGSDAHITEYVGFHFPDAAEHIRSCGFRYITHYEKRKPVMLPL